MFKIEKLPNTPGMFSLTNNGVFVKAGTKSDLKNFIKETNSKPKEFKGEFYCLPTCTECCHQYIDITETEIFKIRRTLRKMDANELHRIKTQKRVENVCPLLDVDNGLCSVYEAKPDICKAFGCYTGALACTHNLDVKLEPVEEYFTSMFNNSAARAGKLGVDFTWDKGLL